MKIRTGAWEVLESGLVHSNGNSDVEFWLSDQPPLSVAVRVERPTTVSGSVESSADVANRLVFTFQPPVGQINYGLAEQEMGTLSGRKLFGSFRVNVFGDYQSFEVSYTLFLGEAI